MTTIRAGAAVVALTLTGFTAHASCSDPRSAAQHTVPMIVSHGEWRAHESIVGTWKVTYPNGSAFIQWHSDGTEWENINLPVLDGNLCMGSWEAVDRWHYTRNHYGWLYASGVVAGYFNETETDLLAADGNSYSGTNSTTFYDLNGKVTNGPFLGTSSAERISP